MVFAFGANEPLSAALSLGNIFASGACTDVTIRVADGDDAVYYALADGNRW